MLILITVRVWRGFGQKQGCGIAVTAAHLSKLFPFCLGLRVTLRALLLRFCERSALQGNPCSVASVPPPSPLLVGPGADRSPSLALTAFGEVWCCIAGAATGKSTLADRLIQATDAVGSRDMKAQLLDNMDLERERGITIKLQAVRLNYLHPADGLLYAINLIDTPGYVVLLSFPLSFSMCSPCRDAYRFSAVMCRVLLRLPTGTRLTSFPLVFIVCPFSLGVHCVSFFACRRHVDFSYEVSRSLMACEGALLVVDATQGVEAQTLANTYIAMENNLEIIPVINKIDMASAEPDRVVREVEEVVGIDCSNAVMASAKAGIGIEEILSHIVGFIPPPQERAAENLRALIFDSAYDSYRGVRFVTAWLLGSRCLLLVLYLSWQWRLFGPC